VAEPFDGGAEEGDNNGGERLEVVVVVLRSLDIITRVETLS
jgi:hypothetical protein